MSMSSTSTNAVDPKIVFQRLERFYSDMRAGDLDAAMTLYDPDAQVIRPAQPVIKGVVDIRRWWEETLKDYEFRVSPRLVEATDVGAVVLQGQAVGSLVSRASGACVDVDSWFVQIYRRQATGEYLFWRGASGPNPKRSED